ncbi:DNA-directed RNA polymerase II subunit 7 [Hokovirus HKV1]|uniref:DNA-directed RNA polymerase II subunit 7 n=1 Tax=Hokovirus HKV1 TaxID=1977638 RepID=A0A1V0SGT2_9VIRU|nr:DNA-directed RNA polymerase II subunit 7 [Hokovirus HKV1]
MNITSPYISTVLYFSVMLKPDQMNENIYNNLKENIITQYKSKCYKNYGYIIDIIKIIDKSDGTCDINNTESGANFNIMASVILCKPLNDTFILCQLENITKVLIMAKNGPINVIIIPDRMHNNFIFQGNELKYKYNDKQYKPVVKDDIVKIKVEQTKIVNNAENITIMGYLYDMATENEIQMFYDEYYKATNFLKLVK